MANALYDIFKVQMIQGNFGSWDINVTVVKAAIYDAADYTFSASHSQYTVEVQAAGGEVAVSAALTDTHISTGAYDASDFTWTAVSGDVSEQLIFFSDIGAFDTPMIFYDTGITGMPLTPNGGNVNCTIHASGLFAL